jgi:type I restriction enzyme S subunit
MKNEVPQGWQIATLGEIFDFKYGKGLTQEQRISAGTIKVYGSNGIVGTHDNALTRGKTIVIGRKGSVGEVHLSCDACWPIDTTYFIDEFPDGIPAEYWALYLKVLRLGQQEKSSAIPGISREDIYPLEVPIPPLAEQKRIVLKLEELLTRVSDCQRRNERISVFLKRFRHSVLAAACSGRLTADWRKRNRVEEGWPISNLGAVISTLDQGWSPKCEIKPSPSAAVWGVIKTTAVQAMKFLEDENKSLPNSLSPRPEFELQSGDLLITRAGPRARAGVCCLVRSVRSRLMACDKVYRFRTIPEIARAEFIELVLNTLEKIEEINALKTGISDSGVNLTQEKFRAIEFALPTLEEQTEIVCRVEAMFDLADRIETRYEVVKQQVDRLPQSILAKAFRGELVPTEAELAEREGRPYESAEQLLDRIRSSAARLPVHTTRGRGRLNRPK